MNLVRFPWVAATLMCAAFVSSARAARAQEAPSVPAPVQSAFPPALLYTTVQPDASPPGANDWTCRPSAAHPRPVILIHGTAENAYDSWAAFAPEIAREGYCVFAPNLGGYAGTAFRELTEIAASARELAVFVDQVLDATGASAVDLVGHSQGGMLPRYYLKYLGGAAKVHELIALAPSNYGTTLFGALNLLVTLPGTSPLLTLACTACTEQVNGSPFLTDLNAGGDTVPGVEYVVIETAFDDVVTPFTNAFLRGPGATNILLQSVCLLDNADHFGIMYDPIALRLVENSLDPAGARPPPCVYVPPVFGAILPGTVARGAS